MVKMKISFIKTSVLSLALCMSLYQFCKAESTILYEEKEGIQVHWRSNSKNATQLSQAIERLYEVLYNTGNLPTREIKDREGLLLEKILRSEGLYYGTDFLKGADAVVCDLNPKHCNREREKVLDSMLKRAAGHVGGFKKTYGSWTNQPGSVLTVPKLSFKRYTELAEVPYRRGDDLEKKLADENIDCSQWQVPCMEVVKKLNPSLFDPKRKIKGDNMPLERPIKRIILPVTGVETDLVLTGTEDSKYKDVLIELDQWSNTMTLMSKSREKLFTEEWKKSLKVNTPADLAVKGLSSNILSTGKAELQSCFKDPLYPDQRSLLSLIKHPFIRIEDMDEIPDSFKEPIPVAVLDTWFDKEHCELMKNVELLSEQTKSGSNRPKSTVCGEEMTTVSPNEVDDHGTHVAGLIASDANEKGLVGLNPYAKVKYISIDMNAMRAAAYRDEFAKKMRNEAIDKSLRTANISWAYSNDSPGRDSIRNNIRFLKENTLFVVAAGNDAASLDQACGNLPACLSDWDNVITVVGLDRNEKQPHLWRESEKIGSNWSLAFNIGAIAEKVLSTTYKNYTGRLSGTSQAAPQVTAAASLLYSVYEKIHKTDQPSLLPIRVKNRLIYTSDLFNGLLDKLEGGRLNIERALDTSRAYVVIEKNGKRKTIVGRLIQFGNKPTDYITCRRNNGNEDHINRLDLRRMFYDEYRRKYIIFYNSKPGDPDSPLKRITDCQLTTIHHIASILQDSEEEAVFEFHNIRDYISAMF
jgi:hypothetical protein